MTFPVELPLSMPLGESGFIAVLSSGREPELDRFPDCEVPVISIEVRRGQETIAEGTFYLHAVSKGSFEEIWVSPGMRRRGIATAVYDLVGSLGIEVVPSSQLDDDGTLLWEARTAVAAALIR